MSGLSREILKWIQSLDLAHPIKNPKRDFANGFIVAEIFSKYYPSDVTMHSFDTGISIKNKLNNWEYLERFIVKYEVPVDRDLMNDVIHNKGDSGIRLIEIMYTFLTKKTLPPKPNETEAMNDSPSFLRPTASKLIKDALSDAELRNTRNPDKLSKSQVKTLQSQNSNPQAESIIEKQRVDKKHSANTDVMGTSQQKEQFKKLPAITESRSLSVEREPAEPAAPSPAKQKQLAPKAEPKPVVQDTASEEVQFKEVQIKPVEINLSQLRSGKSVPVRTQM